MTSAREILRRVFGYETFRPLQEDIVATLVGGDDAFVLMPTGGGKSLCYQIPAMLRRGTGVVVSPLISLMKDQVDSLAACGVAVAHYNSTLSSSRAREVLSAFHRGQLDLLYVSPERLTQDRFLERLKTVELALFAIDEAHCVSQWGHDFRPEYAQLAVLREHFPRVPVVALTATADPHTRQDILRVLRLRSARQFVASFDRPNIRYTVLEKLRPKRQLLRFLDSHRGESGIVYCLSRKRTEKVAETLNQRGFSAAAYHAGLADAERRRVQDAFQRDELPIVVATVAFGMGIDKSNVRFVVHYDVPKNVESYYQETGRAGRDDLPAEALLLFGYGDVAVARGLIRKITNPDQERIESHKLGAMVAYGEAETCRRRVLLNYFGETLESDCGNCDLCLDPPRQIDATEPAQKALSCVYRVRQSFGMRHIIDVLRGAENRRVLSRGHQRLSTYGIGRELSRPEWTSLLWQLVHRGYLIQDVANYSVLRLTPKAGKLLRGDASFTMASRREYRRSHGERRPSSDEAALAGPSGLAGQTDERREAEPTPGLAADEREASRLFEVLRGVRRRLAADQGVPPFIIFSDASLNDMVRRRPTDDDAFLEVHGVGSYKLERYGEPFLAAIRSHLAAGTQAG